MISLYLWFQDRTFLKGCTSKESTGNGKKTLEKLDIEEALKSLGAKMP